MVPIGHAPRAALLFLSMCLLPGQEPAVFRTDVALVRADAEVRTASGPVNDLTKDNFLVLDSGRPRPILYFAHDEQPLDMVLLFDTSGSMRPVVARVAGAAHSALGELRPGDRVAIMAFGKTTDLLLDFTEDFAAAEASIGERVMARNFEGYTPILPALAEAARFLVRQPAGDRRRAILIVTDDEGTTPYPDALRELWRADAVVVGVIVVKPGGLAIVRVEHYVYLGMRNLAVKTGGDSIDTADAVDGVHEMLRRLRNRYSLYYALPPARAGEERKIEVRLTRAAAAQHPGALVRARTGYIAP
jgi:VWFA-related protein